MTVLQITIYGSSGSWGACGLKGPLLWEEEEGRGGLRAPFLGTAPPCPFLMEGHCRDRG